MMETMKAIINNDGIVENIAVVDPDDHDAIKGMLIPSGLYVGIGWGFDGTNFTPPPEPLKTAEEVMSDIMTKVQARLDDFARTRNYDNILSASTYATSTVSQFASEGQYAVTARDLTWAKCFEILDAVSAGQRTMPTPDDLLSELPELVWPV